MAKQIVNIGDTGQSLVNKLGSNFTELYDKSATIPTTTNQLTNNSGFITQTAITSHNTSVTSHPDIRELISNIEIGEAQSATIEVGTVITGDPGTNATVTNRGTSSDAIFDFTIPQGQNGIDASVLEGEFIVSATEPIEPQPNTVWIKISDEQSATTAATEGMSIAELPVGSIVVDKSWSYLDEHVSWRIVSQNHNSLDSNYPENATTLMAKHVLCFKAFDAKEPLNTLVTSRQTAGNNRYLYSNLRQWLNATTLPWYIDQHEYDEPPEKLLTTGVSWNAYDTEKGFMGNMSQGFKNALLKTSVETIKPSPDGIGNDVIEDYIFLASAKEILESSPYVEGVRFSYFSGGGSYQVSPTNSAVLNNEYTSGAQYGTSCDWFVRTKSEYVSNLGARANAISSTSGLVSSGAICYAGGVTGVVPFTNINKNIRVSVAPNSDGEYEIILDSSDEIKKSWDQVVLIDGEWVGQTSQETIIRFGSGATKEQEPVYLKTFDGSDQPYHPDILYFADKKFGYRYVMSYTPFPKGGQPYRERWECPCIAASNNLVDLFEPEGLTNPLDDLTQAEIANRAYFSDPFLMYNPTLNRIEIYYRLTDNPTTLRTVMYRKYTTTPNSLETWSDREFLYECTVGYANELGGMVRSGTMIYDNGIHRMWFGQNGKDVTAANSILRYAESPNGKDSWTNLTTCVLSTGNKTWHPSVKYYNGIYHLLNYRENYYTIDYYTSTDGINFTYKKAIFQTAPNTFYSEGLYRSDLVYNGNVYTVIITTYNKTEARFAILQGKDMMNLQLIDGDYWGRQAREGGYP